MNAAAIRRIWRKLLGELLPAALMLIALALR